MPHWVVSLLLIGSAMSSAAADELVPTFVREHCADCHNARTKEKDLDLTALALDPSEPQNFAMWVKVHDRVQKGEMPPADALRHGCLVCPHYPRDPAFICSATTCAGTSVTCVEIHHVTPHASSTPPLRSP